MRRLAVVIILAAACGNGSATPQPQQKQTEVPKGSAAVNPAVAAGGQLFVTLCGHCHGNDAKGYKADHAPSLVNPTFLASASDDFIRRGIMVGRPGTSMAAYGKVSGGPLDDAAINQIVAWLRSQGPVAEPNLPPAGPGDATRGQAIYAKTCQKCHGDQNTRGEAVHLANARFQEMASEPFLRYAIVHGRPGTPMEAFAGKLSDGEIDDVVAFVRTFGKPPVEAQLPAPTGKEPLIINPGGKDPKFDLRADPGEQPRFVSVDQVKKALAEKRRMVIIDARPASDWMRVHITGAVSIPYMDMKRLDELPKDGSVWVIAYCACPHHLSGIVVDELRKRGYKRSVVLDEGILEWHRRGYPVVAAEGVLPPPKEAPPPAGTIP